MEMTRYLFNSHNVVPEYEKYFIIAVVVVTIVYLGDFCRRPWRPAYTTKLVRDVFYTALIASAVCNAASVLLPQHWELELDPNGAFPDWAIRVIAGFVMAIFGAAFIIFRTEQHRYAESVRLGEKSSAHAYRRFRRKETRCLRWLYVAYYVFAGALISVVLVKSA